MPREDAKLRVGNGIGSEVEIGPMIHERQLKIVESQVDDAIQRGARLLAGGTRLSETGPNFYAPTLLADVTTDMRVMQEEHLDRCCLSLLLTATKKRFSWRTTVTLG